jgi:CheY-like chemotaxis protein
MNEPSELKHKRRILIVEDEPIVAMSLELLLEYEGFEIAGIAETVQEAMAMIAERSFDAVVLDINLQGRFSCEVAAALQRLGIPFVVVSGYDPDQQREHFPKNTRFLQKPYLPSALNDSLRSPPR